MSARTIPGDVCELFTVVDGRWLPAGRLPGEHPTSRLNALLKANSDLYAVRDATADSGMSDSLRCCLAKFMRHHVRYAIGGCPTAAVKRRANVARDRPDARASVLTVQSISGVFCMLCSAVLNAGSRIAAAHPMPGGSAASKAARMT